MSVGASRCEVHQHLDATTKQWEKMDNDADHGIDHFEVGNRLDPDDAGRRYLALA